MKRLVLALGFVFALVAFANAQTVYSVTADTLNGAETVKLPAISSSFSEGQLTLQALCSNVGGTSDGTLIVEGSVDGTSYVTLSETAGKFNFYPGDTLTITDGAVMSVVVTDSPFKYYRFSGTGTASDSTLVTPKFIIKK